MKEELEAGDYVTASVRLLRPLAQGGMGTVWLAEHLVLDTKVVVKLMTREIEGHAGAAARFSREAAVAAAVKSPHVVQVFDSGVTAGGVAFIVMELLDGHDLGAHLTARGRMAPGEVAVIMGQLGKALAKAHRVGVIHRDLKPDNIFLCEVEGDPFVKLLDFGTAKDEIRAPNATTLGQLIGTPYYMSPEQITGKSIDARTDIWSLGVVAYEALTGVRPFEGITVGAITLAIHTEKPRMTTVVPELPDTLDDWFARACARDPADRFQTARAATDALVRAITGELAVAESGPASQDDVTGISSSLDTGGGPPSMMASSATSLSSTLASPGQRERRTMLWLSAIVGASAIGAAFALITSDSGPRQAPASLQDPLPAISAIAPARTASARPPPSAPASAMASAPAPATAFAPSAFAPSPLSPPSAQSPTSSASGPSPFPFAPAPASASAKATPSASAKAAASARPDPPKPPVIVVTSPPASASAPAVPAPSASSPSSEPAPSPPPASTLQPLPEVPSGPIDLRDLLPPATP